MQHHPRAIVTRCPVHPDKGTCPNSSALLLHQLSLASPRCRENVENVNISKTLQIRRAYRRPSVLLPVLHLCGHRPDIDACSMQLSHPCPSAPTQSQITEQMDVLTS